LAETTHSKNYVPFLPHPMTDRRSTETPIASTFPKFLTDKGKGETGSGGNYRRNAERRLENFRAWALGKTPDPANADPPESWRGVVEEGPITFEDLDTTVFGDYARYLKAQGYAHSTIQTYYAFVASWCGWAHGQGYLSRHYARESDAEDPLPDGTNRRPGDQQAWDGKDRDLLTRHVDREASAAIDRFGDIEVPQADREDPDSEVWNEKVRARFEAIKRCRERSLVHILAYTGLRGAEFLSDPNDDRPGRNGLRWEDISFRDRSATVYRKNQRWKEASLPEPVVGPLQRYRRLLDPPAEWPVFTTLHRPSLTQFVRSELEAEGVDDERIATIRETWPDLLAGTEHELTAPPALTTDGARRVMQRLSEAAGIDVEGDRHDYLAPHGGRRGMGEVMVREFGYAAAARYLDNTEEQVREAYQHIEAAERADMATEALSRTDQRVSDRSEIE
jgi:integrase